MLLNTCSNFGKDGSRLGNQIFQLCLLYSIKEKTGKDFFLPKGNEQLWKCFDLHINENTNTPCVSVFNETTPTIVFDSSVFNQQEGTCFNGYFQSYKYYEGIRNKILNLLKFKDEHITYAKQLKQELQSKYKNIISVHYRRGDYVHSHMKNFWGDLHSDDYYNRVLRKINKESVVVIFSDDINWCMETVRFPQFPIVYANLDEYKSLAFMSISDINVIANSTFSWWGAYLNLKGEIHCPSLWCGKDREKELGYYYRNNDILLPEWIQEEVYNAN
jgi:hypothetical protein